MWNGWMNSLVERGFCHYLLLCSFLGFIYPHSLDGFCWWWWWWYLECDSSSVLCTRLKWENFFARFYYFIWPAGRKVSEGPSQKSSIHELICVEKWLESLKCIHTARLSVQSSFCGNAHETDLILHTHGTSERVRKNEWFYKSHISHYHSCFLQIIRNHFLQFIPFWWWSDSSLFPNSLESYFLGFFHSLSAIFHGKEHTHCHPLSIDR